MPILDKLYSTEVQQSHYDILGFMWLTAPICEKVNILCVLNISAILNKGVKFTAAAMSNLKRCIGFRKFEDEKQHQLLLWKASFGDCSHRMLTA